MKASIRTATTALALVVALGGTAPVVAGTIGLSWQPVPGAIGYRVYHGSQSGQYDDFVEVGSETQATLSFPDCEQFFLAVKAYNGVGESVQFSNEIVGMPRPRLNLDPDQAVLQGEQRTLLLTGANFLNGVELLLNVVDAAGNPLIAVNGVNYIDCNTLEVTVTTEPTARGMRAIPVSSHLVKIRNPDAVVGFGHLAVAFNEARLDINAEQPDTRDKIDGRDLVWLGSSYAAFDGEARYNADADLDGSGLVDGNDLALLATRFGWCRDAVGNWVPTCP